MSSSSFQNEIPKARINIKLDLHTGGAQKKMELPLKLLVMGDYSNGQEQRPLSEREKININKNNFNSVLAEFQPSLKLAVPDTLAGDNTNTAVALTFRDMKISNRKVLPVKSRNCAPCWPCATCCVTLNPICWTTPLSAVSWKTSLKTKH